MSILKNTKDPVILKKVNMKIWHLKDQLIAILKARLEDSGGDIEKIKDISDLQKEFNFDDQWPQLKEENTENEETTEEKEGAEFTLCHRNIKIPDDKMAQGQAVLYEIDLNKIHFFCEQSFYIGSTIMLKLEIPKSFEITAMVIDCRAIDLDSKIISEVKYPYRIVADFKFIRIGQRTMLRNFLMAIEPSLDQKEEGPKEEISSEPATPEIEQEEEKESA